MVATLARNFEEQNRAELLVIKLLIISYLRSSITNDRIFFTLLIDLFVEALWLIVSQEHRPLGV